MTSNVKFTDLTLSDYTNLSIVVQGDTRKYKEDLKKLGGKYNGRLKTGPGWIFPKSSEGEIKTFINEGKRLVTEIEAKEGEERSQRRAKEWVEAERSKSRSPIQSLSISNSTPTLGEYAELVNLVKNISLEITKIKNAISIIMTDEQKEEMKKMIDKPIKNKSVVKNVVIRTTNIKSEDEEVDDDEEEEEIPRKRLLR